MKLYIDTCVLPRCRLESAAVYRERLGPGIGFELLPMFDLPDFEENLRRSLSLFADGPLLFHEPVFGVEHAAPPGTEAYESSLYHLRLTRKYADILRPAAMVYHLNNGPVPENAREETLKTCLENLERTQEMFRGVPLLIENVGIREEGTQLLDQEAFTRLCLSRQLPVLIDVGHAAANGWDLPGLVRDLRGQIRGFHLHNNNGRQDQHNRLRDGVLDFAALLPLLREAAPEAMFVLEYTRPAYHGEPVLEDIACLRALDAQRGECSKEVCYDV